MNQRITLMMLTTLWVSACYRTSGSSDEISDASIKEDRCGETTVTAYLVPVESCLAQSFPYLPGYESKEGLACGLDIHSSEVEPDPVMPEACGDPPLTSLCFLEEVGMIDRISEGLSGAPRVALDGYMAVMTVCEMTEKGSADEECREQEVFYPCEAESLKSD